MYANTLVDGRPDEAIGICVQLLQHDSTQAVTASRADKRSDILQVLMDAYCVKEDDEQWLRYAIERAQLCQAWGQETEALRIEADIALILNRLGRSEEGFAMMDKVMAALDAGAPSIDRMDAGIVARKRRIHMLEEQGQYADIPSLAQQILDKIADYQKRPSAYAEDSYRLPPGAEPQEWYCQFCQSQAWGFMARAYARMTPVDLDRFHISRRTLNELLSTYAQGRSFPVYINDIRIQEALKLLDEHPEMTLTEIAGTVGLTLPNFREQFKQRYSQTPTEYRQTLRD